MTLADASRRKLDLGRVFGDTFAVIRRRAGPLIAVTFVLSYLPSMLNAYVSTSVLRTGPPTPAAPFAAFNNPLYGLLSLAAFFLGAYGLACQYDIAIGDLEGRRPPLAEVFRSAVGKILPMIGAMILLVLGMMLGMILLFVPGIILGVMWVVALPAVAADTSNPVKALGRSRALTKGNRWRIFGLLLLLWILVLILEVVFLGGLGAAGALAGLARASLPGIAIVSLFSFAFSLCVSVGSAALYVQLRELKGAGGESVAQVFA